MSDRFSLAGKVAVVTGASRGLGRAIALGYAAAGADLVVAARRREDLTPVADQIAALGRRALAHPTDVARDGDAERLIAAAHEAFGRVDLLVNNAGISPHYKRAETVTADEWRQVLDVNLTGTFLCCRAALPAFPPSGGRIVNIVSIGGAVGLPRLAAYCAAKAGVEALTRVLALEWAERGIAVNAIGPGFVATDMTAGLRASPRLSQYLVDRTPLARLAEPDEIVGAAIFLASAASSYMTGQTIYVDGGWTAQ